MGNSFGLKSQGVLGNDFEVSLDNKGKYSATDSFTAPFANASTLVPKLGAPCQRSGWTFLLCEGWRIEPQHGGACKIIVQYTGSSNSENTWNAETADASRFTYELSVTTSEEPLETHYRYRPKSKGGDIEDNELELISDIKTGLYTRNSKNQDSENYNKFSKVDGSDTQEVKSDRGKELVNYLLQGVVGYLHARQIWRVRWTEQSKMPAGKLLDKVGKIASPEPKGAPNVTDGRNWLFLGLNVAQEGKIFTYVAEYELSGRGGWDENFYKKD